MSETPVFDDPEIEAIRKIAEAIESLGGDQEAIDRALRWTVDKYGSGEMRLA
jgi:hypothetical protein